MCLIVNQQLTDEVKQLTGTIKVWKVFRVIFEYAADRAAQGVKMKNPKLRARFRLGFTYQPGVQKAVGEIVNNKVHAGLHVCLTKEEAEGLIDVHGYDVVIPLTVKTKNIIAVGKFSDYRYDDAHNDKQAAVTEFTLTKRQYTSAINRGIKKAKLIHPHLF